MVETFNELALESVSDKDTLFVSNVLGVNDSIDYNSKYLKNLMGISNKELPQIRGVRVSEDDDFQMYYFD